MADGVWKEVYRQLLLNRFFDTITPSMKKGRNGGEKKNGGKKRGKKEKTDDYSGHCVIASRRWYQYAISVSVRRIGICLSLLLFKKSFF